MDAFSRGAAAAFTRYKLADYDDSVDPKHPWWNRMKQHAGVLGGAGAGLGGLAGAAMGGVSAGLPGALGGLLGGGLLGGGTGALLGLLGTGPLHGHFDAARVKAQGRNADDDWMGSNPHAVAGMHSGYRALHHQLQHNNVTQRLQDMGLPAPSRLATLPLAALPSVLGLLGKVTA